MKKLIIITVLIMFVYLANAQSLENGNVFTLHAVEIELTEEVTMDEFLQFLTDEYIPAREKAFVGVTSKFLEAERSNQDLKFGWINYYESVEQLRDYYPEPGKSSLKAKEAREKLEKMEKKLKKYGNMVSKGYTSWIIN